MKPYFESDGITLYHGDLREVVPQLSPVDYVCTDSPYGLNFMEKDWDQSVPGPEYWRIILDACKSGATMLSFGGTRTWHRLTCAIEDAGWEIRDCLMWLYGCLDNKTEVLTRRGWLHYQELCLSDSVLQWNPNTLELLWTRPQEIIIQPYNGPMVHIHNRHADQLLTPNHRIYARVRRHSRNAWKDGYQVLKANLLVECSTALTFALPMAGYLTGSIPVDADWAYLVGWWLTDAWKHRDGKACMFSQCKLSTLPKLRECLAVLNPSEYVKKRILPQHDEHTFYVTGATADRLLREYPNRKLAWDMLDWQLPARLRLIAGLMDGGGSQPCKQHAHIFWSQRSERRAIFLALALSVGWRAFESVENGCIYVNPKTTETQISAKHPTVTENYVGDVWCVRVPQGAFVVRRNGRPFITGNSGMPKCGDIGKMIDKAKGAERKNIGAKVYAGGHIQNWTEDQGSYHGFTKGKGVYCETAPSTALAKQFTGWHNSLKPSWEPIVLAMKALDGTTAHSAEKWGVAGMNIDASRIPTDEIIHTPQSDPAKRRGTVGTNLGITNADKEKFQAAQRASIAKTQELGRYPANLILDGEAAMLLDEQTGTLTSGTNCTRTKAGSGYHGNIGKSGDVQITYGDSGGASRFFYCPKSSKSEKGAGNDHCTVKPLALMKYLLTLLSTPTGGVVLDPFAGSGSTLLAAKQLGRQCIGVELDKHNCEIIAGRLQ